MKGNKASSGVICGRPAGLMLTVIRSVECEYIMIGMIGFNNTLWSVFEKREFSRKGLTGAKLGLVGVKILDAHRQKLPGSPADQNNVENQQSGKISFVKY
jgi:hypothetical protein